LSIKYDALFFRYVGIVGKFFPLFVSSCNTKHNHPFLVQSKCHKISPSPSGRAAFKQGTVSPVTITI
jgi:hypothetical protein